MRYWLEKESHTVIEAANGEAALARLGQSACDLVVTGLAMPQVDGIELIQEVRKRMPGQRILAVSSKDRTRSERLKAAKNIGAHAAIPPSLEKISFLNALDALLK